MSGLSIGASARGARSMATRRVMISTASAAPLWVFAQRTAGIANQDKKARKFNSDCTICHSCIQAMSGSTVLK